MVIPECPVETGASSAARTPLVNRVRGLLAEHGFAIPRDIARLRSGLAKIIGREDSAVGTGALMLELMRDAHDQLAELDQRIASYDRRLRALFGTDEMCRRIGRIEGIGPITATALVAAVGDRTCFKNGREFVAWLGFVPRQRSSGGRARILGISKRGDRYIRTLMIHGARSVLARAQSKTDARSRWIGRRWERRHPNVVAVALANKNARVVWSVLSNGSDYEPSRDTAAA